MTLATACPQCGTTFRVRSEQLAVRGGMVRCGVCKHVFRALDALRALEGGPAQEDPAQPPSQPPAPNADDHSAAPAPKADARPPSEGEFELSVPAFDDTPPQPAPPPPDDPVVVAAAGRLLELDRGLPGDVPDPFARPLAPQARALEDDFHSSIPFGPLPAPDAPGAPSAPAGSVDDAFADDAIGRLDAGKRLASDDTPGPGGGATFAPPPAPLPKRDRAQAASQAASPAHAAPSLRGEDPPPRSEDALFASAGTPRRSRAATSTGAAVVLLLALAAALQATLLTRDTLAARYPGLAPAVSSLSAAFGLTVGLPRGLSRLTIEGFDLQAVPGSSQLAMTAVLRNTGTLPLQWPAMEITLTDTTGEVVVRKALLPADYLRGTSARLDAGIAAGTEVPLRLALQGPVGVPTGYTVNLFYP